MYIKFFDSSGQPFKSFKFSDMSFKDYAVKFIDLNGVAHQVNFKEFSYFIVINK